MFSSFTARLKAEVETLKSVLDTHNSLRDLIFPVQDAGAAAVGEEADAESQQQILPADNLASVRKIAPPKPSWQVYDHCAAFTRLYAVYENFIENLVTDYLRLLAQLYPQYDDLPPSVTTQHRVGVGQILLKLGKDGPYKEFKEKEIIEGLSRGLLGNPGYSLLSDAFLIDPQNYRAETVIRLFSYIGFENCWVWVEKHPLVVAFMQENRDSNETPRTLLHDFVEYRNKASHTDVGEIVATEEIKSIADFVVVLSEALAQLVMKQVVQRQKVLGEVCLLGNVVHRFSDNVVGVRTKEGDVSQGDELFVCQRNSCVKACPSPKSDPAQI